MSIGERRMRVVFQTPTISQNDFGEPDKTFSNLCTSWALVQPLRGNERFAAEQTQAEVTTRIVTRTRSELDSLGPGDRATWSGHTYDIKAVLFRDHRQSELEILCEEHL